MISSKRNPALVFNCHYNGLSIIQELGRKGIPVFALDNVRSIGTFSRYSKFLQCSNPLYNEQEFIDFLLKIGRTFDQTPVLFPTNDHWAMSIARHKRQLDEYYLPCIAEFATVKMLIHKEEFYPWAMNLGYPVPKIFTIKELCDESNLSYPIIAKPKYRRIPINGTHDLSIDIFKRLDEIRMVLLRDVYELRLFIRNNKELLPHVLFQEYVYGCADRMYTIGIYANKRHEVLGIFTGRKIRGFPPDIGDCIVGQSEVVPTELIDLAKDIVKKSNFHGIAEIEFKKDSKTDEFKLIEINPRSWSWVGITPACEVSLPMIAYTDLTGVSNMSCKSSKAYTGEVKYIKLLQDFQNCMYDNKRAGFPEHHMSIRHWWKSLDANKRIYAEFCWDDPFISLYSILYHTNTLFRRAISSSE